MTFYDTQLQQLQEKLARKGQLKAQAAELREQCRTLNSRVNELMGIKLSEQADVDKLEGRSLAAFFYNVVGKMDERLDKERQEAYAARVKYDAAKRELEAAQDDLARCESELNTLRDCEAEYEALLQQKTEAVKSAGGSAAEEIFKTEERLAFLKAQQKELHEAITAGHNARRSAQSVLESLGSAENWGTWDMFGGGGLITHLAKHEHLDEAQSHIESLQSDLRSFKTELSDVEIRADMQITVEGFLRFADFFFDGLFADWAVLDHIHHSQQQVESTLSQIEALLSQLKATQSNTEAEITRLSAALDALVRNAQL